MVTDTVAVEVIDMGAEVAVMVAEAVEAVAEVVDLVEEVAWVVTWAPTYVLFIGISPSFLCLRRIFTSSIPQCQPDRIRFLTNGERAMKFPSSVKDFPRFVIYVSTGLGSQLICLPTQPVLTFEEASMPEYVLREVLKQGFTKRKNFNYFPDFCCSE